MEDPNAVSLRELMQAKIDDLQKQIDANQVHILAQLESLTGMLNERYATQTKALDAAFDAQQTAMETLAVSQEKAVARAETSADKRFESVNEFRQQLADQARTFMPRKESEAADQRNGDRIQELTNRMNQSEGRSGGITASRATILVMIPIAVSILGLILVFATR